VVGWAGVWVGGWGRQVQLHCVAHAPVLWARRHADGLTRGLPSAPLCVRTAGYRNAVLTPNKVEFQRLADRLNVALDSPQALQSICQRWVPAAAAVAAFDSTVRMPGHVQAGVAGLCRTRRPPKIVSPAMINTVLMCWFLRPPTCPCPCRLDGPVVVRKGAADAVGDGRQVVLCEEEGSPRRAGGQVRPAVLICPCIPPAMPTVEFVLTRLLTCTTFPHTSCLITYHSMSRMLFKCRGMCCLDASPRTQPGRSAPLAPAASSCMGAAGAEMAQQASCRR
jgi:hypothetical protein